MSKRALIVVLTALNIFLAAFLVFSTYSPPAAMAQEAARRGNFIMVAAEAELNNDAVYLVDVRNHRMHVFRTNFPRIAGQPTVVRPIGMRDLRADLALRTGGEEK